MRGKTRKANALYARYGPFQEQYNMSELHAVRAKMKVTAFETTKYNAKYIQHKIRFGAVCGDNDDDRSFSDATPSGECWLVISDGRPALDFFEPGINYYVTFTKA